RIADDRRTGGEPKRRQEASYSRRRGGKHVELYDVALDRDTGAHGRFHAASDSVSVSAELGFAKKEHGGSDDTSRHDDGIRQNRVHAAQQTTAHIGPSEEIEAAPFTPDVVKARVIAVGANSRRQSDHRRVL